MSDLPAPLSFKGGISQPQYSTLHPMVAYLKTDTVILADLGDRGTYHEAEWMLSNWTERIIGNGYLLIYAGLVNVECKPMVENAVDEVAKAAGLRVEQSAEWSG